MKLDEAALAEFRRAAGPPYSDPKRVIGVEAEVRRDGKVFFIPAFKEGLKVDLHAHIRAFDPRDALDVMTLWNGRKKLPDGTYGFRPPTDPLPAGAVPKDAPPAKSIREVFSPEAEAGLKAAEAATLARVRGSLLRTVKAEPGKAWVIDYPKLP
jgi:hypothetical protein